MIAYKSYQMNPANYREALVETQEDEYEGADILLVGIPFSFVFFFSLIICGGSFCLSKLLQLGHR